MKVITRKEELMNAITHGFGAGLAIVALITLVVVATINGTGSHILSFAIYGTTMVVLYLASTLYHSISNHERKAFFRKLDHMSIFLLIAGSYTPFCVTVLPGWIGWTILGLVWLCAGIGIILKAFYTGQRERLSTFMYVTMGWLVIPAIKPLYDSVSAQTFALLVLGGLFYTAGTFFFLKDRKYDHAIWHLFVLAGSISHFFSVLTLI